MFDKLLQLLRFDCSYEAIADTTGSVGTIRNRGEQGLKRSGMTDGYGIPIGRVLARANCHDSPLLAPTLDRLDKLGPLPDDTAVHLDAGYDSNKTRALLEERGLHGRIAHKGDRAPIQARRRWHVERTHAWQNAFRPSPAATNTVPP
ncbi:transposase [Streptomyces olivochromogenes]|uniref:Transposase n=1 Tax=Streptomyces olivochromogenes TaxID=1963 RepID=A0A250VTH3_STROL|nr:transposase [Streptomyces olivochromogenes]